MRISDWSSDVCSSDLQADAPAAIAAAALPWLSIRRRNDTALVLARTSASHASTSLAATPEATASVRNGLLEQIASLAQPHAIHDLTVTNLIEGADHHHTILKRPRPLEAVPHSTPSVDWLDPHETRRAH